MAATVTVPELDYIQSGVQAVWFAATFFVLVYIALNKRWWKNVWAQMIVSLDACLWLLDLPNCLRLWFHFSLNNDFFAWYDGTSLWVTAAVIIWRGLMIIYIQLTRERRYREEQDAQVSRGELEGPGSKHGAGWDDSSPAVRPTHSGGNGGGD